ncbi:uncharacterized protein LOC62_03G004954 [Vanrija pseudolonga]|uniref:Uncharacterized protein n=1 Tax=Vanrija pseudolonga TaxID=143232 RepID=A0AAF1BHS1_9TREE|nr:hypothetical protein LOC62_03G004954 [Vanrija pseudolonga]
MSVPSQVDHIELVGSPPSASVTVAEGVTRWVAHVSFERGDGLQHARINASLPSTLKSVVFVLHPHALPDNHDPDAFFEPSVATIGLMHALVRASWPVINAPPAAGGRATIVGLEALGDFFNEDDHRAGVVAFGVSAEAEAEGNDGKVVLVKDEEGDDVPAAILVVRAPTLAAWKSGLSGPDAAREAA